jgi:branched-chain amino acid aminotransferase
VSWLCAMDGVVDIDGVLQPAGEAKISVFDRGFLYGDSVFEVMRTYGRRPFREREHLERLARSCERLHIPLPAPADEIEARVARAVSASREPECWVRVVVTRGVGPIGLDLAAGDSPSLLIFALPLKTPPERAYREGIAVGLVHTIRTLDGTKAAGAKTSNYLASMLALDEVKQRGCEEAIILGSRGEVVEGATSNVFAVRAGGLVTPPISAGILEGITRRTVLELAAERGIPCVEREMRPEDLCAADEVFITSSIREIVPVTAIDGARVGSGQPGPLTLRLLAAFRERAGAG